MNNIDVEQLMRTTGLEPLIFNLVPNFNTDREIVKNWKDNRTGVDGVPHNPHLYVDQTVIVNRLDQIHSRLL